MHARRTHREAFRWWSLAIVVASSAQSCGLLYSCRYNLNPYNWKWIPNIRAQCSQRRRNRFEMRCAWRLMCLSTFHRRIHKYSMHARGTHLRGFSVTVRLSTTVYLAWRFTFIVLLSRNPPTNDIVLFRHRCRHFVKNSNSNLPWNWTVQKTYSFANRWQTAANRCNINLSPNIRPKHDEIQFRSQPLLRFVCFLPDFKVTMWRLSSNHIYLQIQCTMKSDEIKESMYIRLLVK